MPRRNNTIVDLYSKMTKQWLIEEFIMFLSDDETGLLVHLCQESSRDCHFEEPFPQPLSELEELVSSPEKAHAALTTLVEKGLIKTFMELDEDSGKYVRHAQVMFQEIHRQVIKSRERIPQCRQE